MNSRVWRPLAIAIFSAAIMLTAIVSIWWFDDRIEWLAGKGHQTLATGVVILIALLVRLYKRNLRRAGRFFYPLPMPINWQWIASRSTLLLLLITGYLLFTSIYFAHQQLLNTSQQLLQQACQHSTSNPASNKLNDQLNIQRQITLLQHNSIISWQSRLPVLDNPGLDLERELWQCYTALNTQNVITPLTEHLQQQLAIFIDPQTGNNTRAQLAFSSYDQLMAYLMLATVDKVDTAFLLKELSDDRLRPTTITSEQWQRYGPELISFYIRHFSSNRDWAIQLDEQLVADVRQQLIHYANIRNSESAIYQSILRQAAQSYDDLSLRKMLNGVDSQMLFVSKYDIPGIFTRQAWEGIVEPEIDRAIREYRQGVDWVLGENARLNQNNIPPETLRMTLIKRYLNDYQQVWYYFLNDLRWREAFDVEEAIDQLTLLSNRKASPFIALMEVIRYQGSINYRLTIADEENTGEVIERVAAFSPDSAFGKVLYLFKASANGSASDNVSLQTYLDHVSRSQQKLLEITSSSDPLNVAREMKKAVFQGGGADLTDTRDYGHQIKDSLGSEWQLFGDNMFVQPIEQAWQSILQPAVVAFNIRWQTTIAEPWNGSFTGRYPVRKQFKEIEMAELSPFLRPDTGIVDQFIKTELSGVLTKKNGRWVANSLQTDRLRFNPQFLRAINQLATVSNSLFINGSTTTTFELLPRTGKEIKTELIIDEQILSATGTKGGWKTFSWPGKTNLPKAQISWNANNMGMRLYEDMRGTFGFIRLLEKAQIRDLGGRRYLLTWKASDGELLSYELRAARGSGPLALLQLRGLYLPEVVFEQVALK